MESLRAILEKIEAPLLFSSRDSYRHLHLIKDFEATMRMFSKQLKGVLFMNVTENKTETAYRSIIAAFEEAIGGFDKLPMEVKKERIEKAMLHLNKLKGFVAESSIGTSGIEEEKEPANLENGGMSFDWARPSPCGPTSLAVMS